MYLAYIDDSGVTQRKARYAVFAAALIRHDRFKSLRSAAVTNAANVALSAHILKTGALPADEPEMSEFHARDLFRGERAFSDMSEESRFKAIDDLLACVHAWEAHVFYGAVDRQALATTLVGSAQPADVAFRQCVVNIERWIRDDEGEPETPEEMEERWFQHENLCLVVVDDTDDAPLKARLRQSFGSITTDPPKADPRYWHHHHFHDGLYFGDSAESVGLQIADMCAFFIGQHLGNPGSIDSERFYRTLEGRIACGTVYPENGRALF